MSSWNAQALPCGSKLSKVNEQGCEHRRRHRRSCIGAAVGEEAFSSSAAASASMDVDVVLVAPSLDLVPHLERLNSMSGNVGKVSSLNDIVADAENDQSLSIYINVKDDGEGGVGRGNAESLEPSIAGRAKYELALYRSELLSPTQDVIWLLHRLISHATRSALTDDEKNLILGENTFFCSLTAPRVSDLAPYLPKICADSDALELRVDLLEDQDDFSVLRSHQDLRLLSRKDCTRCPAVPSSVYDGEGGSTIMTDVMPIVYTVRTCNQAGKFLDDPASIGRMRELLRLGLRSGAEILDVEAAWGRDFWGEVVQESKTKFDGKTLILGSHHVPHKVIDDEEAMGWTKTCEMEGEADGVKLILSCSDERKVDQALRCCKQVTKLPIVAMSLGQVGQPSRVLNPRFTPVTHPALPFVAAPGQLSAEEIIKRRVEEGLVKPRNYFILGRDISYTLSPALHQLAIDIVGLPHTYLKADVPVLEDFVESENFLGDEFGGTSVTIPYKQDIMKYLDFVDPEAKEIGAVNTVVVEQGQGKNGGRRLIGYNTDWVGIHDPIKRRLRRAEKTQEETFLVVGAGGAARAAAFVAKKLGFRILYWNRTPEKAQDLADSFGGEVIKGDLKDLKDRTIRVVFSSLPAAVKFKLPSHLLHSELIMYDANYKPKNTEMILQGLQTPGCDVIRGSEMFHVQGVEQHQKWFKRRAPFEAMKRLVEAECEKT